MDPESDDTTIPDDVLDPGTGTDQTPEPTIDEALEDSIDRAIEDTPASDGDDLPADEPPAEPAPESDEPAKDEPAADEPKNPEPDDKQPEADKPQPDAETEAEITALGLKEKSAARFRELTAEVKELAPIREQLKAAGIENVADLPQVVKRAQDGEYLVSSIEKTGVTPDDFTRLLDYGATIAAARNGDRAAVERAFEEVGKEYAAIAKALGKEIPGVFDPLDAHEDLRTAVGNGDMDRKHAVELATARERSQTLQQHHQQTAQQQQAEAVQQQALQQIVQFDQQMAQDPGYQAKRPILDAMVRNIRSTLPPHQWLHATQQAYASIPDVAPPPAQVTPPAPAPSAVRPGGPRGTMAPQKFTSVEDALDFALEGPASR